MKITSNEKLAEFIADHLPMSGEEAMYFINAVLNGYYFSSTNLKRALSIRDKRIEELERENMELRMRKRS